MKSNIGNKETMANNLSYYLSKSGKTQKEMAEIVGVATSTFNDWMKAKKYPRIDKIEIMADYFGILKSDLIEDHEQHKPLYYRGTLEGIIGRDADLLEMNMQFLTLDEHTQKAIKQMISDLSAKRP